MFVALCGKVKLAAYCLQQITNFRRNTSWNYCLLIYYFLFKILSWSSQRDGAARQSHVQQTFAIAFVGEDDEDRIENGLLASLVVVSRLKLQIDESECLRLCSTTLTMKPPLPGNSNIFGTWYTTHFFQEKLFPLWRDYPIKSLRCDEWYIRCRLMLLPKVSNVHSCSCDYEILTSKVEGFKKSFRSHSVFRARYFCPRLCKCTTLSDKRLRVFQTIFKILYFFPAFNIYKITVSRLN